MQISLCGNPEAYALLTLDLERSSDVHVLVYQLQQDFTEQLLAHVLEPARIRVLAHHTQAWTLKQLTSSLQNFFPFVWAQNRMMHSKVICLPTIGVTWVGSHNWTTYSWTSARNHSVRVDDTEFCTNTLHEIDDLIALSHAVYR